LPNTIGFPEIYLSVILVFAGIIDYKKQKIPNYLTFPTVITALIYHFFLNGMNGVGFSLGGMFAGIALLIIPYAMGGMGAGDVKLLGAIGSFVGYITGGDWFVCRVYQCGLCFFIYGHFWRDICDRNSFMV